MESSIKKAQISIEYMSIVGITTIIVIFLLWVSIYYSNEVEDTIKLNQLDSIGKDIVDNAESVYYFGQPSKVTLNVLIPDGVTQINLTSDELLFKVRTKSGITDMFYPSSVALQGYISSSYGYHDIVIEAKEGYVWINGT